MRELEMRNAWYLHPMEKQVYNQFETFIKNKKVELRAYFKQILYINFVVISQSLHVKL